MKITIKNFKEKIGPVVEKGNAPEAIVLAYDWLDDLTFGGTDFELYSGEEKKVADEFLEKLGSWLGSQDRGSEKDEPSKTPAEPEPPKEKAQKSKEKAQKPKKKPARPKARKGNPQVVYFVRNLADKIRILNRLRLLHDKLKTAKQVIGILRAIQKLLLNDPGKDRSLLDKAYQIVAKAVDKTDLDSSVKVKFPQALFEAIQQKTSSFKVFPGVRLLLRWVNMQGKRPRIESVRRLIAAIEKALEKGLPAKDPGTNILPEVLENLRQYVKTQKVVPINENASSLLGSALDREAYPTRDKSGFKVLKQCEHYTVQEFKNGTKHGVELHFTFIPVRGVRTQLSKAGFKMAYSIKGNPFYYKPYSKKAVAVAREFGDLAKREHRRIMAMMNRIRNANTVSLKMIGNWVKWLKNWHLEVGKDLGEEMDLLLDKLRKLYNRNRSKPLNHRVNL